MPNSSATFCPDCRERLHTATTSTPSMFRKPGMWRLRVLAPAPTMPIRNVMKSSFLFQLLSPTPRKSAAISSALRYSTWGSPRCQPAGAAALTDARGQLSLESMDKPRKNFTHKHSKRLTQMVACGG